MKAISGQNAVPTIYRAFDQIGAPHGCANAELTEDLVGGGNMQIQFQSISRIRTVLFLAGLVALALGLHFTFNRAASAQQDDNPQRAAMTPVRTTQMAQTLDDRFAAVARLVPSF